ncbi:MAG: glycosyltransferase family 2 protein [Clostridia bacterium]|nr:glycosyltransferase family 2 protein [Clostridia bacterium]
MISVVVIGRNEGDRLSSCLFSIQAALHVLKHEIIYVDSQSTDDSIARAKACGAKCFLLSAEQTTAGLGRYVGAKEAKGEYLLFLDGDMELMPGFCEKAMMTMAQDDVSAVTGIREDVYVKNGEIIGRNENYFGCITERICPEFGGAVFIKAQALEDAGSWSPDTIACEEAELHARLIDSGCRILEIPVPMIRHTDAVREDRGITGTMFSRRRLGEGQALRCAMAHGKAGAYLRHESEKFSLYSIDWISLLLILLFGVYGFLGALFFQTAQLGRFLARGRIRAFVSQKLFFFAFPAGLLTYTVRSRDYTAA